MENKTGLTEEERQRAIDIIAGAEARRPDMIGRKPQKVIEMPVIMNGIHIDLNHIERIDFIIDNLLSPGLSMLAADPKIGKSWFALLMCLCVSQGKKFLDYSTNKCSCLYFALEDSDNRMKNRIRRIFDGDTLPDTFNYSINVNDLSNGLIEQLEKVHASMSSLRLIVIDTLQCIRGQYNNRDGGAYGYDYKEMNLLKNFAKNHNLSILLIHHTSKQSYPGDPFMSISGTRGLTGALDTMMVMKKENVMDKQAKLYVRGRDIGDDAIVLEMKDCKWIKVGTLEDVEEQETLQRYRNNPIVRAINQAVDEFGTWKGRASDLIIYAESKGIHILSTPRQLSGEFKELEYQLNVIDNIVHGTMGMGSASNLHVFKHGEIPFT